MLALEPEGFDIYTNCQDIINKKDCHFRFDGSGRADVWWHRNKSRYVEMPAQRRQFVTCFKHNGCVYKDPKNTFIAPRMANLRVASCRRRCVFRWYCLPHVAHTWAFTAGPAVSALTAAALPATSIDDGSTGCCRRGA